MASQHFIKNHRLLKEDYKQYDGLARFEHVDIAKRIKQIDKTSLLALVGPYGSGKSLALDQAKAKLSEYRWLQFDAWRYPDRKALWDGLIIEVARQLGSEKKALRQIDGHKSAIGKWGSVVPEIFANFADLLPSDAQQEIKEKIGTQWFDRFMRKKDEGKDAGGTAGKVVSSLFDKSPAKRVYEFERVFTDLLSSVKEKKIVIVVEDVDRSGADGINFLETLHFYLDQYAASNDKIVVAIAPVSNDHYAENEPAYLKFATYVEFFHPTKIDLTPFIDAVFSGMDIASLSSVDDFQVHLQTYQTRYFLEGLFNSFWEQMSMRKLKLIIREAADIYRIMENDGYSPDWQVLLCVQASKHIKSDERKSFFEGFVERQELRMNTLFSNTISAIVDGRMQNRQPTQGAIIDGRRLYAYQRHIRINDSLPTESRPVIAAKDTRYELSDRNVEVHIPGYYFKY
jgi:hypothetical protein